jgi:hypothetical protein
MLHLIINEIDLVENLCKLHEKMAEICPIWWQPDVFWLPLFIELSLELS